MLFRSYAIYDKDREESLHDWIEVVLTFKRNATSLWEFWGKISPPVQSLTAKALKCANGETLEYAKKNCLIGA